MHSRSHIHKLLSMLETACGMWTGFSDYVVARPLDSRSRAGMKINDILVRDGSRACNTRIYISCAKAPSLFLSRWKIRKP